MKLKWDQIGERYYQAGCDHGVLYLQKNGAYPKGVAWSGLTSVTENPSGAEENAIYADNMKYLSLLSAETYGATIECLTAPDEWDACNGESELAPGVKIGQQRRSAFGFSYRTKLGNDTDGDDYGYILHLVYGCKASPSDQAHETINESPDTTTFSYTITTTPVDVSGKGPDGKPYKPTASVTINSTKADPEKLAALEKILYGSNGEGDTDTGTDARLPLPDELKEMFPDEFQAAG